MDARRLKFVFIGLGILGSMTFLLVVGMSGTSGLAYYLTVSEFMAEPNAQGNFRVNGQVEQGSIVRLPSGEDVRFTMSDGDTALPVVYHGIIPDTFVDRAAVVVEGQLQADGSFAAHKLLAKCPSKYEAADGTDVDYGVSTEGAAPANPAADGV